MKCEKCGAEIPSSSKFCLECGAAIPVDNDGTENECAPADGGAAKTQSIALDENTQTIIDEESLLVSEPLQVDYGEGKHASGGDGSTDSPSEPSIDGGLSAGDTSEIKEPIRPKKKMGKGTLVGIIVAVACVAIVAIALVANSTAAANREKQFNSYIDSIETTRTLMLSGGSEAEGVCNKVSSIWRNAIYNGKNKSKWGSDIVKYFDDDFNDALAKYYADSSTKSTISSIKSNQDSVKSQMSKLKNPPSGCEDAYSAIGDLYDEYLTLTGLAISPDGNITQFNDSFNKADSGFMNKYKKLDTKIPDKK